MIPISKVNFSEEEENAVLKVLRSGNLVQGEKVEEFEKSFAEYIGTKYAVATSNGTTALHLALLSLGIGKNDEVITTPFSFIASTNCILYTGATPVFVDIKEDFNIDVSKIEEKITKKTKAILPVHLFGNPCDMDKIMQIAQKYNLKVVEDAAQAHGAAILGQRVGSFGDLGCFSFYATKNMTTGEGGMITTNNADLYEKLKLLRNHGSLKRYYHKVLGYNFRMTDMQAGIGIEQLKKLEGFNKIRIENALYLSSLLKDVKGIILPRIEKDKKHVFHQFSVLIAKTLGRESLIKILEKNAVGYGIYYPLPIHKQEEILNMGIKVSFPISEKFCNQIISLPINPSVQRDDLDLIARVLKEALND